jgi:hypothetical protein
MEPNPYQAPKQGGYGEQSDSGGPWNSDQATQLLTEIRDMHRESLALTREAYASHKRLARVAIGGIIFMLLLAGLLFGSVIYSSISWVPSGGRPAQPSGSAVRP